MMKKNLYFRSQNTDANDRFLSSSKYRPPLLNHRKKNLWNDTKSMKTSKYLNENQLDTLKMPKSVQNDISQQSNTIDDKTKSENDVTYTMPTSVTTTIIGTVSGQNEILNASRRTDLLITSTAPTMPTMPTNRMANITPISIPPLADNHVVKAVIESVTEQQPTRSDVRTIRRIVKAAWGRWHPWTTCSRSCGGGVMSQSRVCLSR